MLAVKLVLTIFVSLSFSTCLQIVDDYVPFYSTGNEETYKKLVIAIPGETTTPEELGNWLFTTASEQGCKEDLYIVVPDLGDSPYNVLGLPLVGNLTLDQILDNFISRFVPSSQHVLVVGFSKGGQAVQRYSLVPRFNGTISYLLGCASSWTFMNTTLEWKYGLSGFPYPLFLPLMKTQLKRSNFHIVCGKDDTDSLDHSDLANTQGIGRLERAINLSKDLTKNNVPNIFSVIEGVGHDERSVVTTQGKLLCESQ
eukprot:TRINITY_DN25285_c0_g1_i1.p1 TRINITY_DN25285_c0_g1~~TRINITY_DN25285_c0_g1_i1.p1  ORF type:complete len:255 (-),score=29.01 TRINITY_DN25285_c0_g1_i1:382-1146(-)